ncbi:hypothetical protein GCM10010174_52120 [Kutzneria viridogrisea]|uniref:Sigma 54 modulation/S30EA ribosomal protein C-terminal domain-containing protein n=2 Tax=Kutzneria TaxID=43356 RepID=W5W7U3_9PSEU|nr:HPF/RaiA family ribosome-associated protein [Kutzneria albida]AHH97007.1 hypothetical protein KALB_3643 [Kutzneria albida DSM 43870]MBA8932026.1 ribosome-associated translation inhibitor RaiA [Kutzneria viridogrisea]
MRTQRAAQPAPLITVQTNGLVDEHTAEHVRGRIAELARYAHRPIDCGTVWFSQPGARSRAAIIGHATLLVGGIQLVAFATGATVRQAADQVRTALRRQLVDLAHHRRARVGPRTVPSRVLVRHVTTMPGCASPEQAVLELVRAGQRFGLYLDTSTDRDSAVWRTAEDGYGFAANTDDALVLSEACAIERLELTGEPSLFFRERTSQRGRLLYRRDGDYVLLHPAA